MLHSWHLEMKLKYYNLPESIHSASRFLHCFLLQHSFLILIHLQKISKDFFFLQHCHNGVFLCTILRKEITLIRFGIEL